MCYRLAVVFVALGGMVALAGCNNKADIKNPTGPQFTPPPAQASDADKMPAGGSDIGTPSHPVGGPIVAPPPGPVGPGPEAAPPAPTGGRVHVVTEKGDNYYRMAIKYYGSGSKANQDKIQAANPTIPANKIPMGAKILIPD